MRRNFTTLPRYNGKAEMFDDWKFKAQALLGEDHGYAEVLIELATLTQAPTLQSMTDFFNKNLVGKYKDIDMSRMNKQLYQMLCLNLEDKALSQVKNLYDQVDVNGFVAWWKLEFECTSMTGQRMHGLAAKVLGPPRCKRYGEVVQAIEEWEYNLKLYERGKCPT